MDKLSMKRLKERSEILLSKARHDENLLDAVISNAMVADEIFGFHAQQAVEKLLKALLTRLDVPFKRTHNLRVLMDLLESKGSGLAVEFSEIDKLTPYGTLARYEEGDFSAPLDRKRTRETIRKLREWIESEMSR
jgi:HEPN domain-containing protein